MQKAKATATIATIRRTKNRRCKTFIRKWFEDKGRKNKQCGKKPEGNRLCYRETSTRASRSNPTTIQNW